MRLSRILLCVMLALAACVSVSAQTNEEKPTVYMVGNAHFDTQWRWTVQTSINEYVHNTLVQNFALLEEYPDYIFNFEGAIKYRWAKEYYPDLYEKLKEYVKQGRWHISGASWDANDPNMPSIESNIRNIMLGQEFYRGEFGILSTDIMLPDCFGFGWQLPSVAAHCGLIGFGTQKLQWRTHPFYENGKKIPFYFGIWKGLDGGKVMATLDGGDYSWSPRSSITDLADFKTRLDGSPIRQHSGTSVLVTEADRQLPQVSDTSTKPYTTPERHTTSSSPLPTRCSRNISGTPGFPSMMASSSWTSTPPATTPPKLR